MDARLLIIGHPGGIYQASVIAVDVARRWRKIYNSKPYCVTELCLLGLLTIREQDDLLQSNFYEHERFALFITDADQESLEDAGFVEITSEKVN